MSSGRLRRPQTRLLAGVQDGPGPALDPEVLERFPAGYRHLAYLQVGLGYTVKPDMPGLTGPEVDRLYARGAAWLRGGPPD